MRLAPTLALLLWACAGQAQTTERDFVSFAGMQFTYPYVSRAIEEFGERYPRKFPMFTFIRMANSFQLFCQGTGLGRIDAVLTLQPMAPENAARCQRNGVREVVEIPVGQDALVLVSGRNTPVPPLTTDLLYTAITRLVPGPEQGSNLIQNPFDNWQQLEPELDNRRIRVLGPPMGSDLHDILVLSLLRPACERLLIQDGESYSEEQRRLLCETLRDDGIYGYYRDAEDLLALLETEPRIMALTSYRVLLNQLDVLQPLPLDNVYPNRFSIGTGDYPLTLRLLLYLKKEHLEYVPGLGQFVGELVSDGAVAFRGYLTELGLVPLLRGERQRSQFAVRFGETVDLEALQAQGEADPLP